MLTIWLKALGILNKRGIGPEFITFKILKSVYGFYNPSQIIIKLGYFFQILLQRAIKNGFGYFIFTFPIQYPASLLGIIILP